MDSTVNLGDELSSSDDTSDDGNVDHSMLQANGYTSTKKLITDLITECGTRHAPGHLFPVSITLIIVDMMVIRQATLTLRESSKWGDDFVMHFAVNRTSNNYNPNLVINKNKNINININTNDNYSDQLSVAFIFEDDPIIGDIEIQHSSSTMGSYASIHRSIVRIQDPIIDINNGNSDDDDPQDDGRLWSKNLAQYEYDTSLKDGSSNPLLTADKDNPLADEQMSITSNNAIYIPYKLTSNTMFRYLCLNDIIFHYINIIDLCRRGGYGKTRKVNYDGKLIKENEKNKNGQDLNSGSNSNMLDEDDVLRKEEGKYTQLIQDLVDYVIFELDKYDDFVRYQVLCNKDNYDFNYIGSGDKLKLDTDLQLLSYMENVFDKIPKDWIFTVSFINGVLSNQIYVQFGDYDIRGMSKWYHITAFAKRNIINRNSDSHYADTGVNTIDSKDNKDEADMSDDEDTSIHVQPKWTIEKLIERYNYLARYSNIEFEINCAAFDQDYKEQNEKYLDKNVAFGWKRTGNGTANGYKCNFKFYQNSKEFNIEKQSQLFKAKSKRYMYRLVVDTNLPSFWFEMAFRKHLMKNGIPKGWYVGFNIKDKCFQFRGILIEENYNCMEKIIQTFFKQNNVSKEEYRKVFANVKYIPVNDDEKLNPTAKEKEFEKIVQEFNLPV